MSDHCQVDFYVLASTGQTAERFACRLAMMAWEQGHCVLVLTGTESAAQSLDEIMWDFPPGRFLPHGREASAPVRIELQDTDSASGRNVVINLTEKAVSNPDRFERLLEIVPGDESQRLTSRYKFREYRDQGLAPVSHTI
jgi:DNA polymerase-3 subunit chi